MNPDVFFKNFELLADAPNGVQKLREMILQLAVMGKLVPQDPNDEPASVLIEKVEIEKGKYVKRRKVGESQSVFRNESEDEKESPHGWENLVLGSCIELISGQHLGKDEQNDAELGLPYLTGPADFGPLYPTATRWTEKPKALSKKDDILITVKGAGVGKTNILGLDEAAIGRQLMAIRPICLDNKFVYLLILASYDKFQELSVGLTVPGISREDILNFQFGLPPLAEQKRIVSKVDELMALCDKLEASRQKKQEVQSKLNGVALDKMLSAENQEEFEQNWQRICENFDLLYDNPENVGKLKQAILQLAVHGKLVEQNPEDEPSSVLIGYLKETKDQFPEEDLIPYVLPSNWIWVNASLVSNVIDPQPSHRTPPEVEGGIPYIGMGDVNKQLKINFEKARKVSVKVFEEHKERYQLMNGDFIFGKIGTLGHPVKLSEPFNYTLSANIVLIQPKTELINPQYIYCYMDSPVMECILSSSSRVTTHAAFGIKRIRILPVPLPPLEEQKRIVEKVEQLMGLCNGLESKLRKEREDSKKLMESVVKGLLEGSVAEKTELEKPITLQEGIVKLE